MTCRRFVITSSHIGRAARRCRRFVEVRPDDDDDGDPSRDLDQNAEQLSLLSETLGNLAIQWT